MTFGVFYDYREALKQYPRLGAIEILQSKVPKVKHIHSLNMPEDIDKNALC